MENLDIYKIMPDHKTKILHVWFEDGTYKKFEFVGGHGKTWEKLLLDLAVFIDQTEYVI